MAFDAGYDDMRVVSQDVERLMRGDGDARGASRLNRMLPDTPSAGARSGREAAYRHHALKSDALPVALQALRAIRRKVLSPGHLTTVEVVYDDRITGRIGSSMRLRRRAKSSGTRM